MSNTIDERVVKMQFDNASFEKNVQTSLGTIANLKNALNFGKVDISGIASNIEKITDKVTGMGGIWDTICGRMVNMAVDTGQKIAKAFVFDPPSDGFKEYELKMDSLKVIMESSHSSLEEVNKYLNELNKYSDQTIYSFSDMTASIGKFTNAGVDLDTSVNAIKGIANEAALAGASTQQASHAMYNFAQALSAGSVKLIDWKSIENANMATKDFKEELIKTAVELGTLKKSGDDYISTTTNMQGKTSEAFNATKGFNDSLQAQWMTTDVLTTTLARYADETTDIGARATKAATEVRTFSSMMDALKEAVGSGWAQTWEIIFGNMEEATEFWTSINDVLSGFISKFSDARNNILQDWKDLGGRTKLLEGLANVFKILGNVIQPLKDAITLVFPPLTGKTLADITEKFANFTEKIRMATEFFPMKLFGQEPEFNNKVRDIGLLPNQLQAVSKTAEQTTKDFNKLREVAKSVINGDYGNDSARKDALKKAGFDPEAVQAYVDKVHELSNGTWDLSDKTLSEVEKSLGAVEEAGFGTQRAFLMSEDAMDSSAAAAKRAEENAEKTMATWENKTLSIRESGNLLTFSLANGMSGVINIFKSAQKVLGVFGKAWKDSFSGVEITLGHLVAFDEAMRNFADKMKIGEDALDSFYFIFRDVFSLLKNVRDNIIKLAISVLPTVLNVVSSIISTGGKVLHFLSSSISLVTNLIRRSNIIRIAFDALSFVIKEVGSAFSFVIKVIGYFGGLLSKAIGYVDANIERFHIMALVGIRLRYAFDNIVQAYKNLKNKLAEKLGFKSFDEFTEKADKVVEKIKGFLVPAFKGFIDFLRNLLSGKSVSFDIFKGLKGGLSIVDGLFDFAKEKAIGAKFVAFYEVLKSKFGNIANDFRKIFFKKKGVAGFLDKLIPFKKERTFSEKVMAFYQSVTKNLKEVFESFRTIFFGKQNKLKTKGGIVGAVIPLDKEKESVSKIINFFNKARDVIHDAIVNLYTKVTSANKSTKSSDGLSKLFDFSSLNKSAKSSKKPLETIVNTFKKVKDKLANINVGEALKNAFTFFKDKAIPSAIQIVCDAIGKFEMFVAKIDFKKVLYAAKAARTIVKIFNDIKLAKSFSGMANSIGGFFDNLGGKFGGKEESKTTSFLKIAASLALVAKAISLISEIPEDRLDSSVGVVAGIAAVLTGITIALEKIKPAEGADLSGTVKSALGMAASLYIISKAISNIAMLPENQLKAAEKVIAVTVAVLTGATFALSKMDTVGKSSALAPIGFAIALKMLADTVVKLGKVPEDQIKQGEKNIWKIGLALTAAMFAIGKGTYNYASILAPLAFAIGVVMIATEMVALSMIPPMKLIKGGIVIKFIETLLKSAMQSLAGVDVKVVAAPLAFAAGVYLLGRTVSKLGKLDIGTLLKGGIAVTALGVILVGCMKLLRMATEGTSIDKSVLVGLIALSGSILLLGIAMAGLGKLKFGQILKGSVAIGAIGAILAGVMYLLSNYTLDVDASAVGAMIVTTAMIVVLATTAALIGLVPFSNLLKGIVVIGAVGTILVLATTFLDNTTINPSAIFGLIVMTLALSSLAKTAALVGLVPLPKLAKGVGVILAVAAILSIASIVLSSVSIAPANLAATFVITAAIVVLAATAVAIGIIPIQILRKGVSVVTILGLLLTIAAKELGSAKISIKDIVGLIAIVVGIQMLCMSVLSLGVLPLTVLGKGLGVITILSLLLTTAMEVLGSSKFSAIDIAAPMILVGAILVLAMAVKQLGSLDIGVLGKGLGTLSILIIGLVAAFKILSSVSSQIIAVSAAFVIFGIAAGLIGDAFIKVSIALLTFTQALMLFTTLKSAEQFTGLAVGMMALGAVMAIFIGIVVGFVAVLYTMPALIVPLMAFSVAILMIGAGVYLLVSAIEKFIAISGQIGGALVSAISSIASSAGQILSAVGTAISGALSYIVKNAPAFLEKGGELVKSAAAGVVRNAPQITKKVSEGINKALSWVKKNLPKWLSMGGQLIKKIISGIASVAPKVPEKIKNLLSKAISAIKKNLPKWLSMGKDLVGKLVSGVTSRAGKLASEAKNMIKKATESIKNKVSDWRSIGKNLVSGLVGGITSKASEVANKAASLVRNAINSAKKALDSHSPSRVFIKIGKDIGNGLIIGIDEKGDEVAYTSQSMAERVIRAAKEPFDQLADLLSGDIVTDPTITPTIDLSEIQNDTKRLYSMMSDMDQISFHGNLDLAESTNRSVDADKRRKEQSETSTMDSLINAINGLTALIGNTGNVYNVNGVTYDDGSNVSSAVRSLIRAVKVEGRA